MPVTLVVERGLSIGDVAFQLGHEDDGRLVAALERRPAEDTIARRVKMAHAIEQSQEVRHSQRCPSAVGCRSRPRARLFPARPCGRRAHRRSAHHRPRAPLCWRKSHGEVAACRPSAGGCASSNARERTSSPALQLSRSSSGAMGAGAAPAGQPLFTLMNQSVSKSIRTKTSRVQQGMGAGPHALWRVWLEREIRSGRETAGPRGQIDRPVTVWRLSAGAAVSSR